MRRRRVEQRASFRELGPCAGGIPHVHGDAGLGQSILGLVSARKLETAVFGPGAAVLKAAGCPDALALATAVVFGRRFFELRCDVSRAPVSMSDALGRALAADATRPVVVADACAVRRFWMRMATPSRSRLIWWWVRMASVQLLLVSWSRRQYLKRATRRR